MVTRLFAVLAALVLAVPAASADRPAPGAEAPATQVRAKAPPAPPPPPPPSLTLRQGVVALHLAAELTASKGDVLAPASVAPDLSVGVTDWLTLSAISSGSALTGFRGGAGWGVCVTEDACKSRYTAGGAETLVSLSRGSLALAANVGVLWTTLEPRRHTDLKVGFKLRLTDGKMFALVTPNVWIPIDERYDRVVPHEKQLWVPVSLWAKPTQKLAVGLATGVKGPVDDFKDRMSIPAGILFQLTMSRYLGVGSSLVFGKVLGGSAVMDAGMDARVLQFWLNISSG